MGGAPPGRGRRATTSTTSTRRTSRRPSGSSAVSTAGSTGGSATTRSRSASTCGTGSTASGWRPATATTCSTRPGSVRCPCGRGSSARCARWHFSPRRYVSSALRRRLERERPAIVLSNLQMQSATPFIVLARRLDLTVVGYVASWDHTVGQGRDLERPRPLRRPERARCARTSSATTTSRRQRIVVTGWPQADVFHRRRPRAAFDELLDAYGLDPVEAGRRRDGQHADEHAVRGAVLRAARLVVGRDAARTARFSLLFRPHPRDRDWRERFAAALGRPGAAVQEPSFTDLEALATVLQHADAVVSNAGTILLDALVNDRPAVCVLYDEGAPPGESWAAQERDRRALPRRRRLRRVPRGAVVRGGRRRDRALPARSRASCATGGARSSSVSSGRSTAAAPTASSRRSSTGSARDADAAACDRRDLPRGERAPRRAAARARARGGLVDGLVGARPRRAGTLAAYTVGEGPGEKLPLLEPRARAARTGRRRRRPLGRRHRVRARRRRRARRAERRAPVSASRSPRTSRAPR